MNFKQWLEGNIIEIPPEIEDELDNVVLHKILRTIGDKQKDGQIYLKFHAKTKFIHRLKFNDPYDNEPRSLAIVVKPVDDENVMARYNGKEIVIYHYPGTVLPIDEIQQSLRHEFVHAIDPKLKHGIPSSYFAKYHLSPSNYVTTRITGLGKHPPEFETISSEIYYYLIKYPRAAWELKRWLREPNKKRTKLLPKAFNNYKPEIYAILDDPELRRSFLLRMYRILDKLGE